MKLQLPSTPLGLVLSFCALVGGVELLIMATAEWILVPTIVPPGVWVYADPLLLAAITGPALYFLIFQKMQQDLRARKQAADELHRSEEQFRRLAQISPVGYSMPIRSAPAPT